MAITLEFWKNKGLNIVYVSFNHEVYKLADFLRLPEAGKIIEAIYKKIEANYLYEVKETVPQTVGEFIENHFFELNRQFDVVILSDGKTPEKIIFNMETKYKDEIK